MDPAIAPLPPQAVITILEHLRDDARAGAHPLEVRPDDRAGAVGWVRTLLLAPLARPEHFARTQRVLERPIGPDEPLDAGRAIEAATDGPDALTDAELVQLLTSPRALDDLGRLLYELVPPWWEAEMVAVARAAGAAPKTHTEKRASESRRRLTEQMRTGKSRTDAGGSALVAEVEPRDWRVSLEPAARRVVADRAFGDPGAEFALTLHGVGDDRFDLEMSPAPRLADVVISAVFPGEADAQTFVLRVPAALRVPGFREEDAPGGVRSDPCAALSEGAGAFGGVSLRADGDGLVLVFAPRAEG